MKNIFMNFKERKFIIYSLIAILILQICIFTLLKVFSFQNIKLRSAGQNLIKGFNKDQVISLILSDAKYSFSIDKIDDKWFIKVNNENIPGDSEKINLYLNILKDLSSGIIRDKGEDPETAKKYGFNEGNFKKLIIISQNKKNFIIYIGNEGEKSGTSYISLDNEKNIREVNSFIAAESQFPSSQWIERKIFMQNIDYKEIQNCEISGNFSWFKESYIIKYQKLNNSENFILVPDLGIKLKSEAVRNLLKNLVELKIDDYNFDYDITGMEISAAVKLNLKNGKTAKLDFYKADKNGNGEYIIDTEFNNFLYLIDNTKIKKVFIPINELVEINNEVNNKNP